MEENSNKPEDRDNHNNSNQNKNNYPVRDNSRPISYAESYRRMNERRMREGEISRNTTPTPSSSTNTNANYRSHDSFMDNFTNTIKKDVVNTERAVERGFSKIEKEGARIERRVEKEGKKVFYEGGRKFSKGKGSGFFNRLISVNYAPHGLKYFIIGIYILVLLLAAYFIITSVWPEKLPFEARHYVISSSSSGLSSSFSSFYIDSPQVFGDSFLSGNHSLRPIISVNPFNLVFSPKIKIANGTNATINLIFWINKTNMTSIYLNNNLLFPNLDNYFLIAENKEDYIFINREIFPYTETSSISNESSTAYLLGSSFAGIPYWSLKEVFPLNSSIEDYSSVGIFIPGHWENSSINNSNPLIKNKIWVEGHWDKGTRINGTFRGKIKLAVYTEGNLSLEVVKQDLNKYIGQDEYLLNISDIYGNTIYQSFLEDEGIKEARGLGKEQFFNFSLELKKGVYYISFQPDLYNDYEDSTLKNLSFSTNKVIFLEEILPMTPFSFYKKTRTFSSLGFYYWKIDKEQAVFVSSVKGNQIFNLSRDWISKTIYYNLTRPGEYYFGVEKGDLRIYFDYISQNKNSFFELPIQSTKSTSSAPGIVIINKNNFNLSDRRLNYNFSINLTSKAINNKIQVLDTDRVYFEEARLDIL